MTGAEISKLPLNLYPPSLRSAGETSPLLTRTPETKILGTLSWCLGNGFERAELYQVSPWSAPGVISSTLIIFCVFVKLLYGFGYVTSSGALPV